MVAQNMRAFVDSVKTTGLIIWFLRQKRLHLTYEIIGRFCDCNFNTK